MHTFERGNRVEKFLGGRWYGFAQKIGLCNGDLVGFNIKHPPANELIVTVVNIESRAW